MADEKTETEGKGQEYRILTDGMTAPERGNNRRYVRGEKIMLHDERKIASLLKHKAIVKESDATDEQKKLWEDDVEAAEKKKADEDAQSKLEKEVAAMGGRKDNRTEKPSTSKDDELTAQQKATMQPAGAPKQVRQQP